MSESKFKIHKAGKLRGEKITYKDGTGCCIWYPLKEAKEGEEESSGICFDLSAEDLPDLKDLATTLEKAEADIYVPDPEEEAREAKWRKKEETRWYKFTDWLSNISLSITPFEWKFRTFWVSRPVAHKNMLTHRICHGIVFGPLTITWA